eukprot:XP_003965141.1 PREDICTED: S-phase kinase-associated protein 2 isoform X2 [Takifugu rubripes]
MRRVSMPLQDLPNLRVQGSVLRTNKRKLRGSVSEGLDSECTPRELIQPCSPTLKHQRPACKGKENDGEQFVLARRSRRKKESVSGVSLDHLPDELLLRILFCLPLRDLLRTSAVCRRWHRLAVDECLWRSVDLEGLIHVGPALQHVLKTGVRRLRCPRSFMEELHLSDMSSLQLVQMDMSNSTIPTPALESIIGGCRLLEYLSLEGLQLSDAIITSLSENSRLLQLNLSGCSGFSAAALAHMLDSIQQLNISWCSFNSQHVKSVVAHLSSSVTHLNLSGYRENLTLEDVKVLVTRCTNLQILDLSDSTLLMADCFQVLRQLGRLVHLSLSRCYQIHLAALTDVGQMFPLLGLLDMFGVVHTSHMAALKKDVPHISINSKPFSSIARPTPAGRPGDGTMWYQRCRLRFKL